MENAPAPDPESPLTVVPSEVPPGGSATFRLDPASGKSGAGTQIYVSCWDGEDWVFGVWWITSVFSDQPKVNVGEVGAGGVDDVPWQQLSGPLLVPDIAPPGAYRIRTQTASDEVEAVFWVTE